MKTKKKTRLGGRGNTNNNEIKGKIMSGINNNTGEANPQQEPEISIPEISFEKNSIPERLRQDQHYYWFYKKFIKSLKPFRREEEFAPVLVSCPFENCEPSRHLLIDYVTGEWTDWNCMTARSGNIVDFYFEVSGMFLNGDSKYEAFLQVQKVLKEINASKPLTDVGNAERFVELHEDSIAYLTNRKTFLIYDGKRYGSNESGQITKLAIETMKAIYDEGMDVPDDDRRKKINTHAYKSQAEPRIKSMLSLSQHKLATPQDEFDKNAYLFNCLNGTLDLKIEDGKFKIFDKWEEEGRDPETLITFKPQPEFREHDRRDMISKISSVKFDLNATCPQWMKFLNDIFDRNKEMINFTQRAIGYTLTGDISEQKLFILHGTGRNGKSTFLNVIHALVEEYGRKAPMSAFLRKRSDAASNDIAMLCGARFVSASEIAQGEKLNEKIIKELTGGDSISARFLFKEFFSYDPTFKIWLNANNLPEIEGSDFGIWRRICLIPFNIIIPEHHVDRKLESKLKAELSGILNWAIEGCLAWQKEGLQEPEEVRDATDSFKMESDEVLNFLDEECVTEAGNKSLRVACGKLHDEYLRWVSKQKISPLGLKRFGQRLREKGFEQSENPVYWNGKSQRIWHGIGFKFSQIEVETG